MPNNSYYDDVKIIKKSLKSRLKSCFIIICIAVTIVLTFLASSMLSKALTVGKISNIFVFGTTNINIKKSSLYAVSLGRYNTLGEAEQVGTGASVQGASGFVWQDGDEFVVIGNIYPDYNSGEKVLSNLQSSQYNVSIFEIKFPQIDINMNDYENKQVNTIRKSLEYIDSLYNAIYDYSNKFDQKTISNLAISSNLSNIRGEGKIHINNLQDILQVSNSKIQSIQNSLFRIDEILNQAVLKTIENVGVNHSLKNVLSNIVRIKYDLYCML